MTKTKERPIIFNAQEVNAVLAGKAQHRVPVLTTEQSKEGFEWSMGGSGGDNAIFVKGIDVERSELLVKPCPFGAIGDRLWVQEFHARTDRNDHLTRPHYYADGDLTLDLLHDAGLLIKYAAKNMPRWASRLLLEIIDIRIERVQDISEDDAISEGVKAISKCPDMNGPNNFTVAIKNYHFSQPTAKACYAYLHYLKHGDESWDRNDWVWVVEFKVIKESNDG